MHSISLVITLKNEEDNIKPLLDSIHTALGNLYRYEIVLVDDGSTDNTVKNIKALNDAKVVLVELSRNYGQSIAMRAGIEQAQYELIATLDGDLQNDPSDIPAMVDLLIEKEVDVVAGERANRKDGLFIRKIPSLIANGLIRKITKVHLKDYGCTLRVFRADIAKNLELYGELHRFIPVLITLQGGKMLQIPVKHHARTFGQSKYGINRTIKVVSDLLLMYFFQRYARKPIHLFAPPGIASIAISLLLIAYLIIIKFQGADIGTRPLWFGSIGLFLFGFQLLVLGVLSEIIMRTYYQSKPSNLFRVRKVWQF